MHLGKGECRHELLEGEPAALVSVVAKSGINHVEFHDQVRCPLLVSPAIESSLWCGHGIQGRLAILVVIDIIFLVDLR